MTSRELQIFLTVAECGKMSEAARQLFITQSSVSQAVASIEKEYDILLFERLSNGLFLTEDGKKLLAYSRSFFAVKKDMEDFLMNVSRHHQLKVGATVTVGTCVISTILKCVKNHFSDIDFAVSVANTHILEEMLLTNKIDVGLIEGKTSHPDLVSRDVINDSMVLVCSPEHRFFGREQVALDELRDEIFVLREKGSGTRALFEEQVEALHFPLQVKWSCYNSEAIKNIVCDGHGISVISRRLVEAELNQGRLWACTIDGVELRRHFAIVHHKNKFFSEELKTFVSECEAFARREEEQTL